MITIKRIKFLFKTTIHLVAFLCGITYPIGIHAQHANITFEHFSAAEGLSAPVSHIAQDNFGFLWFGTTDGLNRFDGINFIVYRNRPGDTTSLPNNIINSLHVDQSGRIWAATNGGLCYYDYTDDRFHQIHFDASLEILDQHRVHSVTSYRDVLWFATRTMIHRLEDLSDVKTIPLPNSANLLIKYLYADITGHIWIGSDAGMHVYMPDDNKFIHGNIESPFTIKNKLTVTVHPIVPYSKDTVMIGSWYAGLQKVYISGDSIKGIPFEDKAETDQRRHIVSGLARGNGSQWWIGTYGNGLAWFDTKTNQFIDHFHHNPSDARSLSDDYINEVFTDASGIVWIGTTKGLDKFDPLTQQFSSVKIPVPANKFVVYRLANTIVEDRDDPDWLWLCVSGAGLFGYNKRSQTFELYRIDENGGNEDLPKSNLYSFYYDRVGRAWVGTKAGVYLFDTRTRKFELSPKEVGLNVQGAHTIFQDKMGNYWFATNSNGIFMYNEKQNKLIQYSHDPHNPNSIPDNKVFCLMQDYRGKMWIGTQNRGLCRMDPEKGEFRFFRNDKSNPASLPDNGVYDLLEDDNHHLWIATENGFAAMDLHTLQIQNYNTNDGLCNNTVFSITRDHQDHLWLATNNGLSNFDPVSKQFRNYYTNDGLPINRIDGEVFLSSDSILYFGTTGMISFCRPDKMILNKRIPSIVITDFSILGKKVPVMRNADMLQPIHLNYKQNMITFNFASLNFSNAFLNQYAYKLEGFDDTWINCGNQQSATYTNLNGGAYTFRVKGANNDGVWNETGTHVLLYVHPPFWKTWWFYLLCTLAVAGVLYLFYKIRINQLMRLQTIRTRIARDLHDDIGSTLSSINMISSMAKGNDGSRNKVSEMFNTISSASGQAMELMSDIVWSINPKNDSMEMIIIRMRQYASEILEAANISFTIELNGFDKRVQLPLEIRKDFYLIFKEAINNLAKYSQAQHARITMNFSHNMIHLVIEDDGVGFDMTEIVGGNGMKNMEARSRDIKGEISIYSMPGAGTRVSLDIPLTP